MSNDHGLVCLLIFMVFRSVFFCVVCMVDIRGYIGFKCQCVSPVDYWFVYMCDM
jgi:hypothetical protein